MDVKKCPHMSDSLTDLKDITECLNSKKDICCTDCNSPGPNLWLCLKKNCGHVGCSEKLNDHSTLHNVKYANHCIHLNISSRRVWCYECKSEVYLDQIRTQNCQESHESDHEDTSNVMPNKDSGHGSYATLRTNSTERASFFQNGVGLNVGMSGEGDASDSSEIGEYEEYDTENISKGLIGLQNIGNTCYMNAALQALSNTEPLTRYFIECASIVHILSEGKKPGLSKTYQTIIKDIWMKRSVQSFVNPSSILYCIRNVNTIYRGYHQHDTQEFLRNFMDQLHEELKQPVAPEIANVTELEAAIVTVEDLPPVNVNYDSSEGEYETCDSGVEERSSLSEDSETQSVGDSRSTSKSVGTSNKRRLSQCQSPARRQRVRVASQCVIDAQPSKSQNNPKKQIKYRSIVSDIFDGKLLSSVQCLTCNRVSSRIETFQDLSLPIPSRDHLILLHGRTVLPNATCSDAVVPAQDGWILWLLAWLRSWWYGPVVTLHDCLAAFFSTDELKGDNMYSCEKCNKLRNGIKFSKVLQLPEVLCIHLKRFRHELMYSSKISSAVSFPLKGLDMWPYLHKYNTSKVSNYELFSVICHHGTASGGHYTCFALNGGRWYEYDDLYVTEVPAERVQNCEAYVLFYRKVQTSAEPIRNKAAKVAEEAERRDEVKFSFISKQWMTRFKYCVEPGPIDNFDFLCQHGAFDPKKEIILNQLAIEIPLQLYDYLHKRFGGCAPITSPVFCPACSALEQRILKEMEAFYEIRSRLETHPQPRTHYLSISWYMQWNAMIHKKTFEPPGPIDNSKIDPNCIDPNEAADVPRQIWEFFHSIYGGGPTILIDLKAEDNEQYMVNVLESENEPDEYLENETLLNGHVPTEAGEANNALDTSVVDNVAFNVMDNENVSAKNGEMPNPEHSQKKIGKSGNNEQMPRKTESSGEDQPSTPDEHKTKSSIKKGGRYRRRNHQQ